MRFKTSVSLMIAVVLGLVTAKVGLDMLKKYGAKSGPAARVLVARHDLEPGSVLQEEDFELSVVPASMAAAGKTFKDPKDAVGRTVIAAVAAGYPLSDAVLAEAGAGSGMQALVPAGFRAVAVDVSESSAVAGLLAIAPLWALLLPLALAGRDGGSPSAALSLTGTALGAFALTAGLPVVGWPRPRAAPQPFRLLEHPAEAQQVAGLQRPSLAERGIRLSLPGGAART